MIVNHCVKTSALVLLAGLLTGATTITYPALAAPPAPPPPADAGPNAAAARANAPQAPVAQEKQEDDKVIKLDPKEVQAVRRGEAKAFAAARPKLDGKVGEVTALGWASHQDQTTGKHTGEVLFSFDVGEATKGKRTGITIPVYFKDDLDSRWLKDRIVGDKTPFKVRGRLVVDKTGWRLWMEDGRLVRSDQEREQQAQEEQESLKAVAQPQQTVDGKAFKLSARAVKAMRGHDKRVEMVAKEKWNGKVAEIAAHGWASHQDQTTGPHAGETLFSFDVGEAETGKRTGNTIPVYFKDKADIAQLKARNVGDRTPFRVRGRVVVDRTGWRLSLENARLVKE
jgi:hypothetical protein